MHVVCSVCKKQFRCKKTFLDHFLTEHTIVTDDPLENTFTNTSTPEKQDQISNKKNLKKAVKLSPKRYLNCELCGSNYVKRVSTIVGHLLRHVGAVPFFCKLCQFSSISECHLRRHLFDCHKKNYHNKVVQSSKLHECHICGLNFASILHFSKHYVLHIKEMPFKCIHCFLYFADKRDFNIHNHIHKIGGTCELCGSIFKSHLKLLQHVTSHNKEKLFRRLLSTIISIRNGSKKEVATNIAVHSKSIQHNSNLSNSKIHLKSQNSIESKVKPTFEVNGKDGKHITNHYTSKSCRESEIKKTYSNRYQNNKKGSNYKNKKCQSRNLGFCCSKKHNNNKYKSKRLNMHIKNQFNNNGIKICAMSENQAQKQNVDVHSTFSNSLPLQLPNTVEKSCTYILRKHSTLNKMTHEVNNAACKTTNQGILLNKCNDNKNENYKDLEIPGDIRDLSEGTMQMDSCCFEDSYWNSRKTRLSKCVAVAKLMKNSTEKINLKTKVHCRKGKKESVSLKDFYNVISLSSSDESSKMPLLKSEVSEVTAPQLKSEIPILQIEGFESNETTNLQKSGIKRLYVMLERLPKYVRGMRSYRKWRKLKNKKMLLYKTSQVTKLRSTSIASRLRYSDRENICKNISNFNVDKEHTNSLEKAEEIVRHFCEIDNVKESSENDTSDISSSHKRSSVSKEDNDVNMVQKKITRSLVSKNAYCKTSKIVNESKDNTDTLLKKIVKKSVFYGNNQLHKSIFKKRSCFKKKQENLSVEHCSNKTFENNVKTISNQENNFGKSSETNINNFKKNQKYFHKDIPKSKCKKYVSSHLRNQSFTKSELYLEAPAKNIKAPSIVVEKLPVIISDIPTFRRCAKKQRQKKKKILFQLRSANIYNCTHNLRSRKVHAKKTENRNIHVKKNLRKNNCKHKGFKSKTTFTSDSLSISRDRTKSSLKDKNCKFSPFKPSSKLGNKNFKIQLYEEKAARLIPYQKYKEKKNHLGLLTSSSSNKNFNRILKPQYKCKKVQNYSRTKHLIESSDDSSTLTSSEVKDLLDSLTDDFSDKDLSWNPSSKQTSYRSRLYKRIKPVSSEDRVLDFLAGLPDITENHTFTSNTMFNKQKSIKKNSPRKRLQTPKKSLNVKSVGKNKKLVIELFRLSNNIYQKYLKGKPIMLSNILPVVHNVESLYKVNTAFNLIKTEHNYCVSYILNPNFEHNYCIPLR